MLVVNRQAIALAIRPVPAAHVRSLVPVKTHPLQIVQQLTLEARFAALHVGVLNAQYHNTARLPREQPVKQRGTRIADVQLPGR